MPSQKISVSENRNRIWFIPCYAVETQYEHQDILEQLLSESISCPNEAVMTAKLEPSDDRSGQ